jgi:hypothetical protein
VAFKQARYRCATHSLHLRYRRACDCRHRPVPTPSPSLLAVYPSPPSYRFHGRSRLFRGWHKLFGLEAHGAHANSDAFRPSLRCLRCGATTARLQKLGNADAQSECLWHKSRYFSCTLNTRARTSSLPLRVRKAVKYLSTAVTAEERGSLLFAIRCMVRHARKRTHVNDRQQVCNNLSDVFAPPSLHPAIAYSPSLWRSLVHPFAQMSARLI